MKHGDWIKFVIAVDRRDKHPRATKIELLDESFKVSDERREQGKVNTIKDAFGFIFFVKPQIIPNYWSNNYYYLRLLYKE